MPTLERTFLHKMSKKSNTNIYSKSDTMWFCVKCRKVVEEYIKSQTSKLRRDVKSLWKTMSKELVI